MIDESRFDAVVVATTAVEAARLIDPIHPQWAQQARRLRYEPIVTIYARSAGTRLAQPMLALPPRGDEADPAQFVFDLGSLGRETGLLAFVISGAGRWVECGMEATIQATLLQAQRLLSPFLQAPLVPVRALTEKRATFACTPALQRPPALIAPGLVVAGDYIAGPYPATLEGAVRSGLAAARASVLRIPFRDAKYGFSADPAAK
jgi:predicted NAD/FAD-dependent oxidoreductase